METEVLESTDGVEQTNTPVDANVTGDVDPKITAFVTQWVKRIKQAKSTRYKKVFDRMDECMLIAKEGGDKLWLDKPDNYVVPIINRYINQSVAQIYAKNPTAVANRKKRRMFQVWDGTLQQLKEAQNILQASLQSGQPPDPNAVAITTDALNVKRYDVLMDGIADTLSILHMHYLADQAAQYKQQFKALVRRTKVCGVGYVKLGFQRILEQNPDITTKLNDATERLDMLRRLIAQTSRDQLSEDSAECEQLRTLIADLQSQQTLIVQEGPVFSFPRSKSIIIDPDCVHLKTLAGAGWIAEEFDMTPDRVEEIYKKNIRGSYSEQQIDNKDDWEHWSEREGILSTSKPAKVWRVMNRKTGQEFTICEGYKDYLKPPAPPETKLRRFFDIFPLVFNEIESEKDLIPPSDVWLARHMQAEYNRARQGLREHRRQNRPGYISSTGAFEDKDLAKLQNHASGEIIQLQQMTPDQKIADKLQAKPVMQIDPKQYEVESIYNDILRVTGAQQANLGPTEAATATESSIAEHSRQDTLSDSRDDLDDLLSIVTQSAGELMLRELSKETVVQIVGPGAVWPEAPDTREQITEEILLDVRAGSSGRPNQAADLAKLERAMPFVIQLPGVNPIPFTQKYTDLLEVDAENTVIEGLPSIIAQNAMASAAPPPGAPPQAQGPEGRQNAPAAPGTPPGPQPAFPAPASPPAA